MKNLPTTYSVDDSLRGRITYVRGGNESYTNALDIRDKAYIKIMLPRTLGAFCVYLKLFNESLSGLVLESEIDWFGIEDGLDVYRFDIDPKNIGVGLYFYSIEITTPYSHLFAKKDGDTIRFTSEFERSFFQMTVYNPAYSAPNQYMGGIIYHIFVDRFNRGGNVQKKNGCILVDDWSHGVAEYPEYAGAPLKNNTFYGGTLWGIINKLDYIKSLGVNLIYLSPIFDAASNHKYDTADYMTVDPMFGGEEALVALIKEAKKKNIGIILDGVFNHTGSDSIYFNREGNYKSIGAYNSKSSEYFSWFDFKEYPDRYTCWWDIDILPRINPDNPKCGSYFVGRNGVVEKYAKLGITGFRLDVVDELSDEFVANIKKTLNKHNKNSILYGEVWEDGSNKIAYDKRKQYYLGSELDGVMNYPIRKGIISFLTRGDTYDLHYALTDIIHNAPDAVQNMQMNLLGTHDTERIITLLGGESAAGRSNSYLRSKRMNDIERGTAKRRIRMAYTILATIPGIPVIFYGDETALEGYHDPFNRMPYPWDRQDQKLIGFYQKIGRIRGNYDVYQTGTFKLHDLRQDLLIFSRSNEKHTLVTVVNNSKYNKTAVFECRCRALISEDEGACFEIPPFTAEIYLVDNKNNLTID